MDTDFRRVEKCRGVQEVGFISIDGVSGLGEGAKAIFPEVVVQRCIVHLIGNSLKYVPTRDYKVFTAHLKKIYGASSIKACRVEFERFCQVWAKYPGAIAVWKRCFAYVEQLFDYSTGDLLKILNADGSNGSFKSSKYSGGNLTLTINGGGKIIFEDVASSTKFNNNGSSYNISSSKLVKK